MVEEITTLLGEIDRDRDRVLGRIFERLYPELRRIAAAKLAGHAKQHTLTPTVIVGELYLKFAGAGSMRLQDRRHFYACAAKAMRQIVVDHARQAATDKRGGDRVQVTLTDSRLLSKEMNWIDLGRAMEELREWNPELYELVDLKFFAGLSIPQIAEMTETSSRTVSRNWIRARAFLHVRLAGTE